MKPFTFLSIVFSIAIAGFSLTLAIVLALGMTFGQKCEKAGYARGTAEFEQCVRRLADGEDP